MNQVLLVRVESLEQGGREAARGSQAGPGRNIRHRSQLQKTRLDLQQSHRFPNDGMLDFLHGGYPLHL